MGASAKEISNIISALAEAEGMLDAYALATVVAVEGSSYRRTGARMLIKHDGTWTGSISGGCLEGNALRRAREVILSRIPSLVTYDTRTDDSAKAIGASLGCNGVVQVWLEPIQGSKVPEMLRSINSAFLADAPSSWVRVLRTGGAAGLSQGDFLRWEDFVNTHGFRHEDEVEEGLLPVDPAYPECLLSLERLEPAIQLLVFGAGDDVKPLVQLGVELGWRVFVSYDCPAKTLPRRFPGAEAVLHLSPQDAVRNLVGKGRQAVVVVSHNYNYDMAVLRGLAGDMPGYVGVLGPRKRFERICVELGREMPHVHAPIGLDIGAQTPFEIALAVVAEVNAVMHGRSGAPLRQVQGFIHSRNVVP